MKKATKYKFPKLVDKTPTWKIVPRANYVENGYFDNIEYELKIVHSKGCVIIQYYGEDDTYLTDDEIKQAILIN